MQLDIISYPDPYPCFQTCKKVRYIFLPFSLNFYYQSIKLVPIPLNYLLYETVGEKAALTGKKTSWTTQNLMVLFTTFSLHSYYRHRKDMDMIFQGFLDIYPDPISKIKKGYNILSYIHKMDIYPTRCCPKLFQVS